MAKLAQLVPSWDAGGRAQLVASFADVATPTFSSPDDRGNLSVSESSYANNVFTFKCRWDNTANSTGARFLYAQVDGVLGLTPVFRVVRSNFGVTVGSASKFAFSYDGVTWSRFSNRSSDATYYIWSHNASFAAGTVYVALFPAWPTGRTLPWIQGMVGTGYVGETTSSSGFVFETRTATVDELGDQISATPMYAFKVSSSGAAPDGAAKRNLVLMSGVHASEDAGNYLLKGAVEFLVSEDAQARTLRSWFDTYVYPVVASAGRKGGSARGDFQSGYMTSDLNRSWNTNNFEAVSKHKTAILADTGGAADVFMDFHADFSENTGYDQYHTDNDGAVWTTALQTYEPTHYTNDWNGVDQLSTAWAQTALTPDFSLSCEVGFVTVDTTQARIELAGANRMRALALLAEQEYFGSVLSVEGSLIARETGLDSAVILGSGEFYSTGTLAATESGLDSAAISGVLYAASSTGRLSYVGRVPIVTQATLLGTTTEWIVLVDDEITTFLAE